MSAAWRFWAIGSWRPFQMGKQIGISAFRQLRSMRRRTQAMKIRPFGPRCRIMSSRQGSGDIRRKSICRLSDGKSNGTYRSMNMFSPPCWRQLTRMNYSSGIMSRIQSCPRPWHRFTGAPVGPFCRPRQKIARRAVRPRGVHQSAQNYRAQQSESSGWHLSRLSARRDVQGLR